MKPLLIILGPTASGKTSLATQVCSLINGEVISADSRQIYRDMDIGTGKDLHEYTVNGHRVPYHLIDIRDAGDKYNVNQFQKDFKIAYQEIGQRGATAVVCGGTGFYLHAVLSGHAFSEIPVNDALRGSLEILTVDELRQSFAKFDTAYKDLADTTTRKRLIRAIEISQFLTEHPEKNLEMSNPKPGYEAIIYGLDSPVEVRRERISKRLTDRLENGLVEEVQALLARGISPEQLIYYGLEYKFLTLYLTGEMTYNEMKLKLETEIHRFAKRQMTFFRKMEKDGFVINWLNYDKDAGKQASFVVKHYEEATKKFIKVL
ncbi:tRNA (adenosine(37)-N6)-dimethylallyltransferase MiaA [Dyadobacter sp. CY312]|uniref:tRNA (adenosine(37)-N6)-dimethylallyltransferase MiaA n=1 Tax=Dyadobacter sp. CY312 TaxID=2907303 RepID=UPI001F021152|nr:tRNA (adenosine(37)-N6)-dimethylallyltransferase MiaA [Dyadobacter sp. CY312]MCE7039157.1 tRNA (adenosine(37)-N6)-dimethylallyltransferase MiaA [Dyadobacter sp. CY312]